MALETYRRKNGKVCYSYKFRYAGKVYRDRIGIVTRTQAERALAKARADVEEGKILSRHRRQRPQAPPAIPTMDAFTPRFMLWYATDARPRSVEAYRSRLELHLLPRLGEKRLDELSTAVLDAYRTERRHDGASPRTINGEISTLSKLLRQAVAWGVITPAQRGELRWLRADDAPIRVLTPAEEDRLVMAATPRLRPLIRFALQTGLRRNELLGLEWTDIDWPRREVHIPAARAKGRRGRTIPLNETARDILDDCRRQPPRHGARIFGYKSINHLFVQAVRKAGLQGVNIHTLRHTFSTRCLEHAISPRVVQTWLGHASLKQTERYLHISSEYERRSIEVLGEQRHRRESPPA